MERTLDDLVAALDATSSDATRSTSIRLPESLHRAVLIATALGMDDSFTAATTHALTERLYAFVRRLALAEHFQQFPADVPNLAGVTHERVRGTDHPAVTNPHLVDEVAEWVEQRQPDWAVTGRVDGTVDDVLRYVEMLSSGIGTSRRRSA